MRTIHWLKKIRGDWLMVSTVVKYGFSLLLCAIIFSEGHEGLAFACLVELLLTALFSNFLCSWNKRWQVANDLIMFMLNVQMALYLLGGSYLTFDMLSNITLIGDLAGHAFLYISTAIAVTVVSLLPIRCFKMSGIAFYKSASFIFAVYLLFTMLFGSNPSPLFRCGILASQSIAYANMLIGAESSEEVLNSFYKDEIYSGYSGKNDGLPNRPNVVLIFTEGLSQGNVEASVETAGGGRVMPSLAEYESKSLFFTEYFNHTCYTYRGLIGSLYSGYQLSNTDGNALTSLQSVLSHNGYHTVLINPEPCLKDFSNYLRRMGFDEFISDASGTYSGMNNSLSDKEAYELLYETMLRLSERSEPFLTVIYTYGTHVSLDSPDERFGDGTSPALNKFYNMDRQFGRFMEKFNAGPLAENTLLIFTSDHGSATDRDYLMAFPDANRQHYALDRIPLFFYFKGIEPRTINAQGRNSLDLAPTICDYLDISEPNYFLGNSLFVPHVVWGTHTVFSYTFCAGGGDCISTANGVLSALSGSSLKNMTDSIRKYYSVARIP